jgi:hypothetical protein
MALQQTPTSFAEPLLSVAVEPAQREEHHSLRSPHFTTGDFGLYGTGQSTPMNCTCGQTVRLPLLSQAYSRFADDTPSPPSTYISSFAPSSSYQSSSRSEQNSYSPL